MDPKKVARGKKSKAAGSQFENRVRADLEEKGWIVDKWTNNVSDSKLVKAKAKWAGPNRPMMMGAGFPDFVCFRIIATNNLYWYEVIGVESKMTGELDKPEKEKCVWLLDNQIFSKILIAEKTKVKNRVVVVYHDFKIKYRRFL